MADAFAQGCVALRAGDLVGASAAFDRAVAEGDHPGAHRMLGGMAFAEDRYVETRRHWEAAYAGFRDCGELPAAVRVAADLIDLHASVLGNHVAANGWTGRATRLLTRCGPGVEAGYLALARVACDVADLSSVEAAAALALGLALEYGDSELEVRALADSGLALVCRGQLEEGFARLDEALAAISAGEVANLSVAGKSFCAMLTACERTGDVRRAEEWTRLIGELMVSKYGRNPRVLVMHCRAAYGSVLCSTGRWADAEVEITAALGPDGSTSLYHRLLTVCVLAELRLLQGRLEDAELLLAGHEDRLAACVPLARLHLARREPGLAAAVLRRGLTELVGDHLRSGPLLALLVEAALDLDDLEGAADAARQLTALAEGGEGSVLKAEAALACGRVAASEADVEGSIDSFECALRFAGEQRPILRGTIHDQLSRARAEGGDRSGAVADARVALAIFERIGATGHADRTAAHLRTLGAPGRSTRKDPTTAVAGLSPRERDVLALVRVGLSNAEIAGRLFITAKTAEHHVGRVLSKLGVRSRAEAAAVATAAELHL